MKNMKALLGTVFVIAALSMTGCAVYPEHHDHGYGPPPHAPAHGYRYKHHGHELVYDSGLGVYVVIGVPHYYFVNDIYYRYSHDGWYYSRDFDRDWQPYKDHDRKLPPGLAKKYRDNDKDRGRGRGRDDDRDHEHDRD